MTEKDSFWYAFSTFWLIVVYLIVCTTGNTALSTLRKTSWKKKLCVVSSSPITMFTKLFKKSKMLQSENQTVKELETLNFIFANSEFDESGNGHYFNHIHLPEEIIILIFSYVPPTDILKLGLVCKKWYNILRIQTLWNTMYLRKYKKIPKPLPWYIFYALFSTPKYFDGNLLKNNCGQEKFNHWTILKNGGNKFKVERKPVGCDPYALNCPDFNNATSCYVTSYLMCQKVQNIPLSSNLIKYIVNKHKPHIYASEWVAGRFDCGGSYALRIHLYSNSGSTTLNEKRVNIDENLEDEFYHQAEVENQLKVGKIVMEGKETFIYNGNEATKWKMIEVVLKDYADVAGIVFEHGGVDNQFWQGHYGPKMAGGVLRLLFESMDPELISSVSNGSDEEID